MSRSSQCSAAVVDVCVNKEMDTPNGRLGRLGRRSVFLLLGPAQAAAAAAGVAKALTNGPSLLPSFPPSLDRIIVIIIESRGKEERMEKKRRIAE